MQKYAKKLQKTANICKHLKKSDKICNIYNVPIPVQHTHPVAAPAHPASGALTVPSYGSSYGSAGSLYGSNLGTLQPYGQ